MHMWCDVHNEVHSPTEWTKKCRSDEIKGVDLKPGEVPAPPPPLRSRPLNDPPVQLKQRKGDQPLPTPNDELDIQSRVITDIKERREVGIKRYGTALQPNNGRDALQDAYEEAIDLCMYLKQLIVEREINDSAEGVWIDCKHKQENVNGLWSKEHKEQCILLEDGKWYRRIPND